MKKLFLFIGVIMSCLLFSCKKDSPITKPIVDSIPMPPPPVVDSFLLHPPPVLDSLPIPFTTGTWWKYQRNDSTYGFNTILRFYGPYNYDSSIELITVLGKTSIVNIVNEIKNNIITRTRYDTVSAYMLEVKNLTKVTVDTNYASYYNSNFFITPYDSISISIKLPLIEGTQVFSNTTYIVKKDTSVIILNKHFDNCIHYQDFYSTVFSNIGVFAAQGDSRNVYLKSGVGIVHWEKNYYQKYRNQPGSDETRYFTRRLIDYHIAP